MKKNKLIFIIILAIIIIAIIIFTVNKFGDNSKEKDEYQNYIPEEEISEQQARQTIVTLYFVNKETGKIDSEARLIDAVTLIDNPYQELVNLLISGPKNDKLNKIIPEGTKINSATRQGDCVIVDFSEEFLNCLENEENKNNAINSIVNTLTELNEVNSVKFLIDNNENENIKDTFIRINEIN